MIFYLALSIFITFQTIKVESKCGYLGIACCDELDVNMKPCQEGQGTCIDRECCPNKGESCCDVFGASNCCNPAASYCVGGICTDIAPCGITCLSDDHCCPATPHCYNGECTECANAACKSDVDCCDKTPNCYLGRCTECGGDPCKSNEDCCGAPWWCSGGKCVDYVIGRPYNLYTNDKSNLRAYIVNNCPDIEMNDKYIDDLLSEHASIATFNKFSIELMNFGAPLWFIELSQNAALDEINHTKIMLNILNNNYTTNDGVDCIEIGKFPNHNIDINGDCNAISLDVVNGGCFGETKSSINSMKESNKFNQFYSVALDEVRHSALAWISTKWMINNCKNIDISHKKWWINRLKNGALHSHDIIKKMFDVFWHFNGNDYHNLYKIIHHMLHKEVLSVHQKL